MKLAFSTNAFTKHTLDEALGAIARIGYQGAEIMADEPHLWPPDTDTGKADEILARSKSLGLELCSINGFTMRAAGDMHHPSWIDEEAGARDARVMHTLACLGLAHRLGVPFVSTEPGGPVETGAGRRGKDFALFARELDRVIPRAGSLGVKLLIEPEPGLLFENMDDLAVFLEDMEAPELGVNFDAGHFFCINDDPAGLLNAFGSFVDHVHIEDIGHDRVHRHLIPGRGAMDFGSFFDALKKIDYKGFVTVELYPYDEAPEEAAEEAFRFLKPYFEGTL